MEQWKKLKNTNYSVSNFGNIKNNNTNKELKQFLDRSGYKIVSLCIDGKRKTFKIHRFVAKLFCNGYSENLEVNHIDGNKTNNHYSNLEWCSRSQNLKHAHKNNLINISKAIDTCKRKVLAYKDGNSHIFSSIKDCANFINVSHTSVSLVVNNKRKEIKGWEIEFC